MMPPAPSGPRYRLPALLLLLGLLNSAHAAAASATAAPRTAEQLAQAVYDRATGRDSSARVQLLLENEGKPTRQRLLYVYGLDEGNAKRSTLMRFTEPQDVAGTGLLSMDYAGAQSDQWLYLPALDKIRRIASNRKGGRFVGSDFYYEDLGDREVNMDTHRLLGPGTAGGVPCVLLESIPTEASNSIYSKRLSCIHEQLLIPLSVELFQGDAQPVKRLQARKIKKIQGYWTVLESAMHNLQTGQKSTLVTSTIVYDQGIPPELFSQRGLADDSMTLPFRPDRQDISQ